ncbi:MAG: response regulator [Chitinophagia bacterium]|nr:response regulator [Chitinophagia bacterium]
MKKALIIDDDLIMVRAIGKILNADGYETELATDGKEALVKLQENSYDLIITDIMMPYCNGLTVLSTIKGDESKKDSRVIVMSSAGNPDIWDEVVRIGADGFLKKPISKMALLDVVNERTFKIVNKSKLDKK